MTETENYLDDLLAVNESSITSLIDEGVACHGKLVITNGKTLLVSGSVFGGIDSNGSVIINQGGLVHGAISAKSLQVAGTIERISDADLIHVEGAMILSDTAVVNCDAKTGGAKIAYGACMYGRFSSHEKSHSAAQPLQTNPGAETIEPSKAHPGSARKVEAYTPAY
jgi:cytoskeletal protein CcmA (bactofilin family)